MNAVHYNPELLATERKKKITQKELAERLGVAEMTIYRAETGQNVSYELLADICREIGLDVRLVINPTEPKNFCLAT